jgi:ADP-ribose pyrophosphatase
MSKSKPLKFEILEKESLYKGFFQLNRYTIKNELFAGGWSETFQREIFERGHASAVLLLDPNLEVVVLVEQFRPGAAIFDRNDNDTNAWVLELVAGMIESGQSPESVAKRESVEEAGCHITRLSKICEYLVSPGGTTEKIWLFLGEVDASQIPDYAGLVEEHEDIKIHKIPVEEAFELLEGGRINNAMALIGLQWLRINWSRKSELWDK